MEKALSFQNAIADSSNNYLLFSHLCKHSLRQTIDIESLQNRLLKVCYVTVTSASLPRVSFFFLFFFVAAAINSTNEANMAGGTHC
jgi:hypothetical protein